MNLLFFRCDACKGKGWVFDFLYWPKDHWPERCPICRGRGGWNASQLTLHIGCHGDTILNVWEGRSRARTSLAVLDALVESKLLPWKVTLAAKVQEEAEKTG